MPELPEVETVRRGIAPRIAARTVRAAVLRAPALRWPLPADLDARIRGASVLGVERRGKYLLIAFDAGWLIVHLGMSGTLRWTAHDVPPRRHDHVDLVFDDGVLRLHDPRRFGAVLWHPREAGPIATHPLIARLGLEPMDTDVETMARRLHAGTRGRRVSIKSVLLAGELVVGVGNIYASESLFRARIHPASRAGRLGEARCLRLAQAIRDTLADAIARGGSTLRDFASADGESGYFQLDCLVYDRAGQPCRACGGSIRRLVQQQRATFYCPACQR